MRISDWSSDVCSSDLASFRQAFLKDPSRRYPVVEQPGPDSMVVRVALTDVMLTVPRTRLLGYTPVGLAVRALQKSRGISPSSAARRVGKEGVSTGRTRVAPPH